MSELELKFPLSAEQAASLRGELRRRGARSTRMVARYFDTADGRLASHGMSLRLRREGRRWTQTLKAAGDSVVQRLEHDVPLRLAAGCEPMLDLARHDGSDAGRKLRDALAGGGAPLQMRYRTDFARLACDIAFDGAIVEAALDSGTLHSAERSLPISELELELKSGPARALFALACSWREHASLWIDSRSKSLRGSLLAEGRDHAEPVKAATPRLGSEPDGDRLLRAIIRATLDQVLGNASEIAVGSGNDEHIHQLRVGLRRLRTALRELAPLADGVDPRWSERLASTFARLGELRDDAAVARAVRPLLEQAGAPRCCWTPATVGADAGSIVRDTVFQATLLELLAFALDNAGELRPPHEQAMEHVTRRLSVLHKQVVRGGRVFETLPAGEQHQVRKRLKRLRYLAEFVEPLWDRKNAQRYLRRLGPAQDALGAHNDVAVARDKFLLDARNDPQALFAAGFLQAHLAVTARLARAALEPVGEAAPFWKR